MPGMQECNKPTILKIFFSALWERTTGMTLNETRCGTRALSHETKSDSIDLQPKLPKHICLQPASLRSNLFLCVV